MLIADKGAAFDSGIALLLQQECQVNEVVNFDSNWEVEVRSVCSGAFRLLLVSTRLHLRQYRPAGRAKFSAGPPQEEHFICCSIASTAVVAILTCIELWLTRHDTARL
jgi:hypothetical protein